MEINEISKSNEPDLNDKEKEERFERVIECWNKMIQAGVNPTLRASNTLLRICSSLDGIKTVQFYFDHLKENNIYDHRTFDILIGATMKRSDKNDYLIGEKLIEEMLELVRRGLQLDNMLCNSVLRLYARIDIKKFEKFLEYIITEKIKPDIKTHEIKVDTYCRLRKYKKALHVVEEAIDNGFKPTPYMINCFLSHSKDKEIARKIVDIIINHEVRLQNVEKLRDMLKTTFKEEERNVITSNLKETFGGKFVLQLERNDSTYNKNQEM